MGTKVPEHVLSEPTDDCTTRFLERDGSTLSCPYHTVYDEKGKRSNAQCGDWCPLFDYVPEGNKVQLHCGSGNAEYQLK